MMGCIIATSHPANLERAWETLAPPVPHASVGTILGLGALVVVLIVTVSLLERARQRVHAEGRLYDWLMVVQGATRAIAIFITGGLFLMALPARFTHLIPWVLLAAALGAGFTLRDLASSLLAWVVLLSEGHLRPGMWIEVDGKSGVIRRLGPRVLWLVDTRGRTLAIPNDTVLHHTTLIHENPWPIVVVDVRVPDTIPEEDIPERLREATLTAPWVTPCAQVHCSPIAGHPNHWRVETRVLAASMHGELAAHLPQRLKQGVGSPT